MKPHQEVLGWVVLGALIQMPDAVQFAGFCRVPKLGFRSEEAVISGI